MDKNLEIKRSFFYFPHGIHRLHIDLKMRHILVFVSRLLCHDFNLTLKGDGPSNSFLVPLVMN